MEFFAKGEKMQKKDFLLKIFLLISVVAVAIFVGGCSHTHIANVDWGSTAAEHFHTCTKQNCSEHMDVGKHEFSGFSIYEPATCTKKGLKFRECTVCGYTNWVETSPLGHNYGTSQDVIFKFTKLESSENDWSCTATRYCIRDGCDEVETETISTKDKKLSATEISQFGCGQDEVVKFTNPDFENDAFDEAFSDQEIYEVITKKRTQEHNYNYDSPTYEWGKDYEYCVASVTCQNSDCGVVYEEESSKVESQYYDATCTEGDYTIYTATFKSNRFPPKEEKVAGNKSPLGHNYGPVTYSWATDCSTCTASNTCQSCKQTFSATAILNGSDNNITYKEQQQTCVLAGYKKYVATFKDSSIFPATENVIESTEALSHEWGDVKVTWSVTDSVASCTVEVNCIRNVNNVTCSGKVSYTISNINANNGVYTADFTKVDDDKLSDDLKQKFGVRTYSEQNETTT